MYARNGENMGKMKQLLIETREDEALMMEEAHYWALVDNVAQWMVDNKSTVILSDIEKKVLSMYEAKGVKNGQAALGIKENT